jgi:hypothetical protein
MWKEKKNENTVNELTIYIGHMNLASEATPFFSDKIYSTSFSSKKKYAQKNLLYFQAGQILVKQVAVN